MLNLLSRLLLVFCILVPIFIFAKIADVHFYDSKTLENYFSTEEIEELTRLMTSEPGQEEKDQVIDQLMTDNEIIKIERLDTGFGACLGTDYNIIATNPLDNTDKNWEVRVRLYRRVRWLFGEPEGLKSVVIVPPTGGFSIVDKTYANRFCGKHGMQSIVIRGWTGDRNEKRSKSEIERLKVLTFDEVNPSLHDKGAIQALSAIRLAVKFLKTESPVGILGNSVGAISASLALTLIDQIHSGVFITGGADLPGIIARSTEKKLITLRNVRSSIIKNSKASEDEFKDDDYLKMLRKNINISALSFIDAYPLEDKPKQAIVVVASDDVTVHTEFQEKLFASFNHSPNYQVEKMPMTGTHGEVIGKASLAPKSHKRDHFADFFNRTLQTK